MAEWYWKWLALGGGAVAWLLGSEGTVAKSVDELPDSLPGYDWVPSYWQQQLPVFATLPDMIVLHSGDVGANVAEYLANPLAEEGAVNAVLCSDGKYRRKVGAHFAWSLTRNRFVQQFSLRQEVPGAGSVPVLGKRVNGHAIQIELSGPYDQNPRSELERNLFQDWVSTLLRYVRSIHYWTRHSDIDAGKHDPGPGFSSDWLNTTGLTWVSRG